VNKESYQGIVEDPRVLCSGPKIGLFIDPLSPHMHSLMHLTYVFYF